MTELPEHTGPRRPTGQSMPDTPSFAWPILLIGAGVIFLLANLGMVPGSPGFLLSRLWPVILIVIGIELVLGRRARWLSALLALLVVAAVIALLFMNPPLPFLDPSSPPAGSLAWIGIQAPGISAGAGTQWFMRPISLAGGIV
jgi:hypothetical protein